LQHQDQYYRQPDHHEPWPYKWTGLRQYSDHRNCRLYYH
jgi:hypothetical protein